MSNFTHLAMVAHVGCVALLRVGKIFDPSIFVFSYIYVAFLSKHLVENGQLFFILRCQFIVTGGGLFVKVQVFVYF